jgi:hypothetical protein
VGFRLRLMIFRPTPAARATPTLVRMKLRRPRSVNVVMQARRNADGFELGQTRSVVVARQSQILASRSSVDVIKARQATLGGAHSKRRSLHGPLPKLPARPHVMPRYTYAEIQAAGKNAEAHKREDGTYNFPVKDSRDLLDLIHAIGRAPVGEKFSIKTFAVYRAQLLGLKSYIPASWKAEVHAAKGG